MGLLRLLLALSVVADHVSMHPFFSFVKGEVAVSSFFVISGFYIALIYSKNYKSKLLFWKSRYYRLFPAYAVCTLAALFCKSPDYWVNLSKLPTSAIIFLTFTNITMFFQDITMFTAINGNSFNFTTSFTDSSPMVFQYLLNPQCWSLGLEIFFYLLAPFIIISKYRIITLILFSAILKLILVFSGFFHDPWSYRFFPSELFLFLIGSLFCLSSSFIMNKFNSNSNFQKLNLFFILALIFFFQYMPFSNSINKLIFCLIIALSLNSLFNLTRYSKLDNMLGQLSYPIYCSHIFVIQYIVPKFLVVKSNLSFLYSSIIILIIIFISFLIHFIFEKPVEKYRLRLKLPLN